MFYRSKSRRCWLISLLCLAAGQFSCTKRAAPVVQRMAVLPFDNLSSDAKLDWLSRAAAAALADDLSSVKAFNAATADSVRSAYGVRATQFVHGYFFVAGGRFELHAAIEDAQSHKSVRVLSASGLVTAGVVPLVDRFAHQLSPDARPFSTTSAAAFRAFGEALQSDSGTARNQAFQAAVQADPNFSDAYVFWAETLLEAGDRDGVARVTAAARADHPSDIQRAQLDYLAANAKGDTEAQIQGLRSWSALTPMNADLFRRLADFELALRKFSQASADYQMAAKLDPQDPAILNTLGYTQAYAGELEKARGTLSEYQKLSPPEDVNALDSLGEVSFYLGDFRAAENYFQSAYQKNPGFFGGEELLKSALARLMTGDLSGANTIFRRYTDFRGKFQAPLIEYQSAQWIFLTGRRKDAMSRLQKSIPALDPDASATALCQLSIWKLQTGDTSGAVDAAQQAAARAISPATRALTGLCRFIASHPEPSSSSKLADAYALLFQRKYAQAVPLLEAVYHATNPSNDGEIRTLLAWAYIETGNLKDAAPLLRLYPIPLAPRDTIFASLIFPRFFYLKGAVLANQGKSEEAKRNYELYLKFTGDLPDIFGDEQQARKARSRR